MYIRKSFLFALLLGGFFLIGQNFQENSTFQTYPRESEEFLRVLNKIRDGIVYCYSGNSKTTGFFVTNDGWILTAGHKVDVDFPAANIIHVKLNRLANGSDETYTSTRIASPPVNDDILLFKIDFKPKYHFTKFKNPYLFEENWIIGFRGIANIVPSPQGFITTNIQKPNLFYTTASMYYGNSGSPVINRNGDILGVAVECYPFGDALFVSSLTTEKYIKETLERERVREKAKEKERK